MNRKHYHDIILQQNNIKQISKTLRVQFSGERQKTSQKLQFQSKYNTVLTNVRYCVSTTDKYRAEEPRYFWYCGTKKYRKGDGTGTVKKWYRGAAVVPGYHAALV